MNIVLTIYLHISILEEVREYDKKNQAINRRKKHRMETGPVFF